MFSRALTEAKPVELDRAPADLGEKLQWLCRFGKPRLGVYGSSGWMATIEMNTNTTGSEFTVRSEHTNPTPEAAITQLIDRMLTALKATGGGSHG